MITLKQETKLIDRLKGLTELELTTLMQELKDHFRREKMGHLFNDVADNSDMEDQLNELEEQIDDLKEKLEEVENDSKYWEDKADRASSILLDLIENEHGEDYGTEKLNEAYNILV